MFATAQNPSTLCSCFLNVQQLCFQCIHSCGHAVAQQLRVVVEQQHILAAGFVRRLVYGGAKSQIGVISQDAGAINSVEEFASSV